MMNFTSKMRPIIKKIIIIAVWLGIWQAASALTGLELLLAGPVNVFLTLIGLMKTTAFYEIILNSFLKITVGFLIAFFTAVVVGGIAGKIDIVRSALSPAVTVMKSLPVASFIILVLIWFGSKMVASIIAALVVFPMVYTAVCEGMDNVDGKLVEMSSVYKVGLFRRIRYIYVPQVFPYIEASLKTALGMCWKAGVSAEVIGLSAKSIGLSMYYSKLYLMTAELFAWSFVVIVVSSVFEKMFLLILRSIGRRLVK